MLDRFIKLFLPFLFTSIGLVVGYAFLKWVVIDYYQLIHPKEELVNYWIPFFLGTAVAYLVMAPRFKVLKLSERSGDFVAFWIWGFIVGPLLLGLSYFNGVTDELTKVNTPSEIAEVKLTTYYNIQSAQVVKKNYGFATTWNSVGRHGTKVRLTCYYLSPLVDVDSRYIADSQLVDTWIGCDYSRSFSTKDAKNPKLVDDFIQETFESFKAHHFQTAYLHRLDNSDKKDAFLKAVLNAKLLSDKGKLFLFEEEKGQFVEKKAFPRWLVGTLIVGNLFWLLVSLFGKLDSVAYSALGSASAKNKFKSGYREVFGIFLPSGQYWLTPILIDLNLIVFLLMLFSGVSIIAPQTSDLLKWGGNLGELSLHGQGWRLVTAMFIHIGIYHLIVNVVILGLLGFFLEMELGRAKLFGLYMLSGIAGSVASAYYGSIVSVGASGAIFGLLGYVIFPLLVSKQFGYLAMVLAYVGINLLIGMNSIADNLAHLGGLALGFLFGVVSVIIEYASGQSEKS